MTDAHHDPLPPDIVDELLSALLDGEFDAAARDLGFEPDDARHRLDATPGIEERRRAFEAARDASMVATPLDELTRRRLVAHAADAALPNFAPARRRSRARHGAQAIGAAAVIAAVIAGFVALGHNSSTSKTASNEAAAPTTASTAVHRPVGSQLANPSDLRQYVAGLLLAKRSSLDAAAAPVAPQSASTTPTSGEAFSATSSGHAPALQSNKAAAKAPVDCERVVRHELHVTTAPIATAAVTYQGAPVRLAVYATAHGTLAVLYDPAAPACRLVITQLSP